MTIHTIEEINAALEPETGWRVELAISEHDRSEFLRLYRMDGDTWEKKVFVWSLPRESPAGVLAACGGVARHYYQLGQASASNATTSVGFQFLPKKIDLPGGVVARIALNPMPEPDEHGDYKPRQDCDIQVSLFRDDHLIEHRRWDTLIDGHSTVVLADGSTLSADDLGELDAAGWSQMVDVGLIPSAYGSDGEEVPFIDEEIARIEDEIESERRVSAMTTFRIRHHYDIGDQKVFVERRSGDVDAKRAAVYCEFQCTEWFGPGFMLSNLAVAAMLVMFYGYRHTAVVSDGSYTDIDMYSEREKACGELYAELMADESLRRDGMREVMARCLDPC